MQDSVYAVPNQIIFKQWKNEVGKNTQEITKRLLIRNPSVEDTQLLLIVPPSAGRFHTNLPGPDHAESKESSYHVPGGEPYEGRCYALPPEGTITCSVMFHATAAISTAARSVSSSSSSADSNFQDALFVYSPSCSSAPMVTVPLLAIGSSDSAPPESFQPRQLHAPPPPPAAFWQNWKRQRDDVLEAARRQQELQQQIFDPDNGRDQPADVFVLEGSDEENEDDAGAHNTSDTMRDIDDDGVGESDIVRRRIAEAAKHAAAEDEDEEMRPSTPDLAGNMGIHTATTSTSQQSRSSNSRSGLTSAGVYRSGLSAQLHSSHGSRSSGFGGGVQHSPAGPPGTVHVFQPYARPATAEQRHLAEAVDVAFVHSTEQQIDELLEEDLDELEEREERELIESAQRTASAVSRPQTAVARAMAASAGSYVPPLNIAPAQMVFSGQPADDDQAEQDEQEFYQQILLTARGTQHTPASTSKPTSVQRHQANGRIDQAASEPPSRTRVGSGRRTQTANRSSPPPSASPTLDASPPAQYPSQSSARRSPPAEARPVSRTNGNSASSGNGIMTGMMRQLSLDRSSAQQPSDVWNDRLAREQEIERRRYVEQHSTPPSMQRTPSYEGARSSTTAASSLKFPKLK